MTKNRGFEVVGKYKDAKLPIRSTKTSAGYDFFAAEDIVVPSLLQSISIFLNLSESINSRANALLEQDEVKDKLEKDLEELNEYITENVIYPEEVFVATVTDGHVNFNKNNDNLLKEVLRIGGNYDLDKIYGILDKELKPTLVPTGIKAYMQDDEYLKIYNRSSNPMKTGLVVSNGVGIIDSDYYNNEDNEGHIFVQFINLGREPHIIKKGDKIAQGIFAKVLVADEDNFDDTERKGGFGSTDNPCEI